VREREREREREQDHIACMVSATALVEFLVSWSVILVHELVGIGTPTDATMKPCLIGKLIYLRHKAV